MPQPLHALIIEARFYPEIADPLLAGAVGALQAAGATHERITVPGVLEIPPALSMVLGATRRRDRGFHLYVMLGCVIRGETGHYDIVANEGNRAVMALAVEHRLAIGNGILTVDTRDQAIARASLEGRNKGAVAARAALALAEIRSVIEQ